MKGNVIFMNVGLIIGVINLFFVGILAGEEFTIRFGVRVPVASLNDEAHIQLRQALIRRLRILVPAIFALTFLSGGVATFLAGFNIEFGLRCGGLLSLITFITITLTGTVPINQAALEWNPATPPQNWRVLIARWERLDTARFWAATIAFVLFLVAMVLQ